MAKTFSTGGASTLVLTLALSVFINSARGQLNSGILNNVVNTATDAISKPLSGALGSITGPLLSSPIANTIGGSLGGSVALNPLQPSLGLGVIGGLASGAAAATSSLGGPANAQNLLGGVLGGIGNTLGGATSSGSSSSSSLGLNALGSMQMLNGAARLGSQLPLINGAEAAASNLRGYGAQAGLMGSRYGAAGLAAAAAGASHAGYGTSAGLVNGGYGASGLAAEAAATAAASRGYGAAGGLVGSGIGAAGIMGEAAAAAAASQGGYGMSSGPIGASLGAASALEQSRVPEAALALGAASPIGAIRAHEAAAVEGAVVGGALAANQIIGREALAADAIGNSHAEAAIAGADMAAHGANNARSASLASNAYRQAKLAGARDRVNIAGTIQNSARISDAAIATHDTATKAEDSLLGSELAVDSASTVLDSDAAYIPPVTSSLLRSLPYGRLGLRNILPRPLTYPSHLLPDVWLNGRPVNYLNLPLRQLPYAGPMIGASAGQPFYSNNGLLINGLIWDPTLSYLSSNINGVIGSSVWPVLANGQLEAQDEIAASHMSTMQQQMGYGMGNTYTGFNWANSVPMLTGSVSDANLIPTTTIGTTYPIGSALVIEPRDSYFQDYIDNASSRQNFDERQQ